MPDQSLVQYTSLFGPPEVPAATPDFVPPVFPALLPQRLGLPAALLQPPTWVGPIEVPGVQVPFLAGRSDGPDWLRLARPTPEFPAYTAPVEVSGVHVPFKSWESVGPDWLRLALRQTPHGTGITAPIAVPGTQVPFFTGGSTGPDWLRLARRLTPHDLGWTAPLRVADVTVTAPPRSWAPVYPDRLNRLLAREPLGAIVTDPTTPGALQVWYGSAPDLPIRRPGPPVALLAVRSVGAAAIVPAETNKAQFGAGVPWGNTLHQYQALVGPLAVPAAAVPEQAWEGWQPTRLNRVRALLTAAQLSSAFDPFPVPPAPDLLQYSPSDPVRPRVMVRLGQHVAPIAPVVVVPAPDLTPLDQGLIVRRPLGSAALRTALLDPLSPILILRWDVVAPTRLYPPARVIWQQALTQPVPPIEPVHEPEQFAWRMVEGRPPLPRRLQLYTGSVAPLRVADVTAAVPDLAWKGYQPDWLSRRYPVSTGLFTTSQAAAIPFLDPSRFGFRGSAPDQIWRRTLPPSAMPSVWLVTPSVFPIPELSWRGTWPDWLRPARRVAQFPALAWEPNARPNPPSPDLAWLGRYPDHIPPAARVRDRIWHAQAPRLTPFAPDFVSGLVVAPEWLPPRRGLSVAARQTGTNRFDIVIPDLRTDWTPSYPARVGVATLRRGSLHPGSSWVAEGDRAVSPTDWYAEGEPRRLVALARVRPYEVAPPPQGSAILVGQQLAWWQEGPILSPLPRTPLLSGVLLTTPPVIAGAIDCVEIGDGRVVTPAHLAGVLTAPDLIDGRLTAGSLVGGEVC